jgi:DNA-binding MarR family transcriptional regulator
MVYDQATFISSYEQQDNQRACPMKTEQSLTPRGALAEGGIHDLLGYQLAQAAILATEAFNRAVGGPLDLRKVEFTILQLVRENQPVTAARVAKSLAVTTPGVKVWLDQLEQRGLITREPGSVDRRTQDLRITRKGDALVSKALTRLLQADRDILEELTEAERLMLLQLLQKVARRRKG